VALAIDTGGLIAFERGDRNVAALVEAAPSAEGTGRDLAGVCRPGVA
jgi:hypothetical protein